MKYLLTMICLGAIFSSCSSDHDEEPGITTDSRTVLVYMSAENNLSIDATSNLNSMIKGSKSLSTNDHLIVFVDQDNAEMPYIAEISQGEITKVKEFATDINAADPREMRDIIKWTATNYPANDYGLVLWGHASGWLIEDSVATRSGGGPKKAYGIDNGFGKWMNTPSMAKYIAETGIKFHYIFADACCFQCVENAYELRNVTDLLIGAPSEIPGYGAPYDDIMPYLFSKTEDFYKGIIDKYENAYENCKYCDEPYSVPLSVIKTDEMQGLAIAARNMWTAMPQPWPSANKVIYYFSVDRKICYDALDIVAANASETATNQWRTALSKAVIYSTYNPEYKWMANYVNFSNFTRDINRMACVSMFVPLETYESSRNKYNEMISHMAWHTASGLASAY